jgi:hypothetical protein
VGFVRIAHGTGLRGLAIAFAMFAFAGCGGSSSPSSTTTTTTTTTTSETTTTATTSTTVAALTRKEFVAKLDDICKRGNEAAAKSQEQFAKALNDGDSAKAAEALQQFERAAQPFEAELESLDAPPADEAAFARYNAAQARIDGLIDRLIVALKTENFADATRLGTLTTTERNARTRAAIELGTEHCGS